MSQFSPGPALPVPYPGGLVISTQIQTPANIPGLVMSLPIAPTDELPEALNTSHYGNELPTDEECVLLFEITLVQKLTRLYIEQTGHRDCATAFSR